MSDENILIDEADGEDTSHKAQQILDSNLKEQSRQEEEQTEKSTIGSDKLKGEETDEQNEGEQVEGEQVEGEQVEGEQVEGEQVKVAQKEGEQIESEQVEGEQIEGEEIKGEELEREQVDGKQIEGEQIGEQKEEQKILDEQIEEEEGYVEEPPPDPTAPYDLSDSKEALKAPFVLRPDQLSEVETLWEVFQDYTPAYSDIDGYITEKELVYMLKSLMLMTYTPEQLQELVSYCVRPPHPDGHISYNQFLKMVTMRQRDFPIEEELRSALQVFDPERTGAVDREYFKEVLSKQGHKLPQRQLDNFIKEVDLSNDGTIGIEDIIGTMCIDLNKDDILMLMESLNPPARNASEEM